MKTENDQHTTNLTGTALKARAMKTASSIVKGRKKAKLPFLKYTTAFLQTKIQTRNPHPAHTYWNENAPRSTATHLPISCHGPARAGVRRHFDTCPYRSVLQIPENTRICVGKPRSGRPRADCVILTTHHSRKILA